ncbi:hypothetical protein Maq22A_1p38435 (plasmid) [Methylobacterium aquaticum]|uniref:Uncharacterized protein n=1 Tax=Methylobacterium aquaticum TaxID=270351 RepID=A0A1Y0ZH24_9HYPH|nr:hypothetical protein Maq22A_1p38435 [Methylobacterium aquaticum]
MSSTCGRHRMAAEAGPARPMLNMGHCHAADAAHEVRVAGPRKPTGLGRSAQAAAPTAWTRQRATAPPEDVRADGANGV